MKIGDLVMWGGSADFAAPRPDTGIIVDGPRDLAAVPLATSYAVAWFDAKTTFWHLDFNLELLSENR